MFLKLVYADRSMAFDESLVRYYRLLKGTATYQDDVDAIFALIKGKGYKSLLDVGCGTGDHAALFKKKGFDVMGIDKSPAMVRQARAHHPSMRFKLADASTFSLNQQFDVVVAIDSVLSFIIDKKKFDKALKNISAHVRKGGVLITDFAFTKDLVPDVFEDILVKNVQQENLSIHLAMRLKRVRDTMVVDLHLSGKEGGKSFTHQERHIHRIVDKQEIINTIKRQGMSVKTWGNTSSKKGWQNLVVMAKKK